MNRPVKPAAWIAVLAVAMASTACSNSQASVGSIDGPVLTSPEPGSDVLDGMAAEVTGTLVLDQTTGCLLMEMEGVRYPLVWPAGITWQEDPPAVVLQDGEKAEPGMTVYGAGGYLYRDHVEQIAGSEVANAADMCAGPTGEIAFFNIGSEVDVILG